jgi:transposase-like protein
MPTEPEGKIENNDEPEFVDEEEEEEFEEEVPASLDHPVCPRCGWSNTRLSHTRTMLDEVLQVISVRSFRCRSCNGRFRKFQRRR